MDMTSLKKRSGDDMTQLQSHVGLDGSCASVETVVQVSQSLLVLQV